MTLINQNEGQFDPQKGFYKLKVYKIGCPFCEIKTSDFYSHQRVLTLFVVGYN